MHPWLTPFLAQYVPDPYVSMRSGGNLEPFDPVLGLMELVFLAIFIALPIFIILGTKGGQSRREEEFDGLERLAMKFKHPRPRPSDKDTEREPAAGGLKNEDQDKVALREDPYGG